MLLDSNVIVAAIVEDHVHHRDSAALMTSPPKDGFAVAAHSFAEAYNTLTRRGGASPLAFDSSAAWFALEAIAGSARLVSLTPAQTLDAIRQFAAVGGVGPRLYDKLLGEAALRNGVGRIATWNVAHFRSLFPQLQVLTPVEALAR